MLKLTQSLLAHSSNLSRSFWITCPSVYSLTCSETYYFTSDMRLDRTETITAQPCLRFCLLFYQFSYWVWNNIYMQLFFSPQWLVKQCAISDLLRAFWPFSALFCHSCTTASYIVILIFLKSSSRRFYIYLPVRCLADIGLVHQLCWHYWTFTHTFNIAGFKSWKNLHTRDLILSVSAHEDSPVFQKWSKRTYLEWDKLDIVLHKNTQKTSKHTSGGGSLFKEGRICSRICFSIFFSIQFLIFNFSNSETQIWLGKRDGG